VISFTTWRLLILKPFNVFLSQSHNTTMFIFALFVVSLSLTPSIKCSVFYINICGFSTKPHFSQYLSNSNSVVFTRFGLSAVGWALTVFSITCVLYYVIDLWGNWLNLYWFLLILIAVYFITSPPLFLPSALKQSPFLKLYFTEGEFKRNVKSFVVTNNVSDLIAEQVM